jgi:hypothetical protein
VTGLLLTAAGQLSGLDPTLCTLWQTQAQTQMSERVFTETFRFWLYERNQQALLQQRSAYLLQLQQEEEAVLVAWRAVSKRLREMEQELERESWEMELLTLRDQQNRYQLWLNYLQDSYFQSVQLRKTMLQKRETKVRPTADE